ncbi:hypothetical protein [Corynebacterium sp. SA-MJD20WY100]|uniref:hypothetical protein n=1 Tax=Corynebacterium sp. SA-MJD20WY100 TaxID=3142969 RepID=UPI003221A966
MKADDNGDGGLYQIGVHGTEEIDRAPYHEKFDAERHGRYPVVRTPVSVVCSTYRVCGQGYPLAPAIEAQDD